jgi:hypothetical protein
MDDGSGEVVAIGMVGFGSNGPSIWPVILHHKGWSPETNERREKKKI